MREPRDNDFFIPFEGVGTFRYGRRTLGDRLAIRRDYLRFTMEFGDDDPDLSLYAALIATHSVLCVNAPPGWDDLSEIDVTDPAKLSQVFRLGAKIKEMEDTFAKGVEKSGSADSPVDGGNGGVPVPPPVSAPAE